MTAGADTAALPRKVDRSQWRRIALLTSPTFALALAITLLSAYVPILARPLTTSQLVAGLLVAGEGLLALMLPPLIGAWSDRTHTRWGARLPFMLAAAPVAAVSLVCIPLASSLSGMIAAAAVFYVAYFTYYTPYRALFPDFLDPREEGRANGMQAFTRALGLGAALGAGGLLIGVWKPLPYLAASVVIVVITGLVVWKARALERGPRHPGASSLPHTPARTRGALRRRPQVVRLLVAIVLWEFALGGLKTFVVAFIVVGMGKSMALASAILAAFVAVAAVVAPVAGVLADRRGPWTIVRAALLIYGVGLMVPLATQSLAVILPVLPIIGAGGAVVMTLPYALLTQVMPPRSHGLFAGIYELSRGIGTLAGPLVVGATIDLFHPFFPETQGYAAMWPVLSLAILASAIVLPRYRESDAHVPEIVSPVASCALDGDTHVL